MILGGRLKVRYGRNAGEERSPFVELKEELQSTGQVHRLAMLSSSTAELEMRKSDEYQPHGRGGRARRARRTRWQDENVRLSGNVR